MKVTQKRFRSPPTLSDGLTYNRTNFSALQATTSRSAHGQVVVNDVQSVINNTTKTTWVKGCQLSSTMTTREKGYQLSTIWVQWQPEWRVISYQQYEYNDNLSERLSVINDTSTMTTWVKGCQLSTIRLTRVKGCQLSTIQVQKWPMWSLTCVAYDLWPVWPMTYVVAGLCGLWLVTYVINDLCGQWLM